MPVRKNDIELPHSVVSEAPNLSQDNSFNSEGTESVVAKIKPVLLGLEDTLVSKHEKQFPLRKPASSIMKMISAFETPIVQVNVMKDSSSYIFSFFSYFKRFNIGFKAGKEDSYYTSCSQVSIK